MSCEIRHPGDKHGGATHFIRLNRASKAVDHGVAVRLQSREEVIDQFWPWCAADAGVVPRESWRATRKHFAMDRTDDAEGHRIPAGSEIEVLRQLVDDASITEILGQRREDVAVHRRAESGTRVGLYLHCFVQTRLGLRHLVPPRTTNTERRRK